MRCLGIILAALFLASSVSGPASAAPAKQTSRQEAVNAKKTQETNDKRQERAEQKASSGSNSGPGLGHFKSAAGGKSDSDWLANGAKGKDGVSWLGR